MRSAIGLTGLVLVLFSPAIAVVARLASDEDLRTHTYLFVALVAVAVWRRRELGLHAEAALRAGPIALLLGAQLAFVAVERWLDAHMVSAALLAIALYALAGLYLAPDAWRRALPALLTLLALLPFGDHAETALGFGARRLTAAVVERVLGAWGVASVPAETVLFMESGIAYVDAPCSGVRSLWTGMVFLFGLTWLERARIDLGWAVRATAFAALLLAANIARVIAIVTLAVVLELRKLADLIHEPLGMLGFIGACAALYAMLRGRRGAEPPAHDRRVHPLFAPALAAVTLLCIALYTPHVPSPARAAPELAGLVGGAPLPLSDAERGLFSRVGRARAEKQAVTFEGRAGTMIVVYSTSWRAHHAPEVCLASAGHSVDTLDTVIVAPQLELRLASLDRGARTAIYWYQSPTRATGELLSRITSTEDDWVMVSAVLEGRWDADAARAFFTSVHASIGRRLASRPQGSSS